MLVNARNMCHWGHIYIFDSADPPIFLEARKKTRKYVKHIILQNRL
jgi:hypothetical protein